MNKVLYRQYRPDTFENVIGQDTIVTALSRAIESERLAHAYLFSGPRGCGKTSSARIFARCLNCEKGPTPTPCGVCPSCIELATGASGSIDVIEMDAASNNGVDNARDLRERLVYAPSRDRFKILILDEAHRITAAAFDALLKIVEEPPEHVKFIFATTEPEKVISTIRSRTYHYSFSLVPSNIMTPFLRKIVDDQKMELDERIYPLLVRVGGGSVRDTLSNLDQLLSSAVGGKVEYDFANKLFGFTPTSVILKTFELLENSDYASLFDHIEAMIIQGISPKSFAIDFINWLRDAILMSMIDIKNNVENIRIALGEYSNDELNSLAKFAKTIRAAKITKYTEIMNDCIKNMTGVTSMRLVLEIAFAKIASLDTDFNNKTSQANEAIPASKPTPEKSTTPAPTQNIEPQSQSNPPLPQTELTIEIYREVVKNVRNSATTILKNADNINSVDVKDNTVIIDFKNAEIENRFIEKGYIRTLEDSIKQHANIEAKVVIARLSTPSVKTVETPKNSQPIEPVSSAKNTSKIQKTSDIKTTNEDNDANNVSENSDVIENPANYSENDAIIDTSSQLNDLLEAELGAKEIK